MSVLKKIEEGRIKKIEECGRHEEVPVREAPLEMELENDREDGGTRASGVDQEDRGTPCVEPAVMSDRAQG